MKTINKIEEDASRFFVEENMLSLSLLFLEHEKQLTADPNPYLLFTFARGFAKIGHLRAAVDLADLIISVLPDFQEAVGLKLACLTLAHEQQLPEEEQYKDIVDCLFSTRPHLR